MDLQAVITTLLASIGGAVAAVAVVGFLGKQLVTHWLDKDLEAHKIQLKSVADQELERLRGSLTRMATEHEVQFSQLQLQRAEIISDVYARLDRVHRALRHIVAQEDTNEELARRAQAEILDLETTYYEKAIWLPRATCDRLNDLLEHLKLTGMSVHATTRDKSDTTKWMKRWQQNWKHVEEMIPQARRPLEEEFRNMLGVETEIGATMNSDAGNDHDQ